MEFNERTQHMKHRKIAASIIGLGVLGAVLLATNLNVNAHSGATGIVKERMALMDRLGKAMKNLNAMFSNQISYDAASVKEAAGVIEQHAGEAMIKMFPEGTNRKPSEALPIIWEDWDEFKSLAKKLEKQGRLQAALVQWQILESFGDRNEEI